MIYFVCLFAVLALENRNLFFIDLFSWFWLFKFCDIHSICKDFPRFVLNQEMSSIKPKLLSTEITKTVLVHRICFSSYDFNALQIFFSIILLLQLFIYSFIYWIQGLPLARKVLCHWAILPVPTIFYYISFLGYTLYFVVHLK